MPSTSDDSIDFSSAGSGDTIDFSAADIGAVVGGGDGTAADLAAFGDLGTADDAASTARPAAQERRPGPMNPMAARQQNQAQARPAPQNQQQRQTGQWAQQPQPRPANPAPQGRPPQGQPGQLGQQGQPGRLAPNPWPQQRPQPNRPLPNVRPPQQGRPQPSQPRPANPAAPGQPAPNRPVAAQSAAGQPQQPRPAQAPAAQERPTARSAEQSFVSSVFQGNPAQRSAQQTPTSAAPGANPGAHPAEPAETAGPSQPAQPAQPEKPEMPAPRSSTVGSMFEVPEREAGWTYDIANPAAADVFGSLQQTDPRAAREAEREQRIEERREQQSRRAQDSKRGKGAHRAAKEKRAKNAEDGDESHLSGLSVRAKGLSKSIDGHPVWGDLTFKIEPGDMVAVVGPSGCGKTTLLNCMGLLDTPTAGRLAIDGTDVARMKGGAARRFRRDKLGFLFYDYGLVDNETIRANLLLAMDGVPRGRRAQTIADALENVGLSGRENEPVRCLSGGEKQRVALARLIATRPGLVLADEPTDALDHGNAMTVVLTLRQLADDGATIVVATHSDDMAGACDYTIDLSKSAA